MNGNQVKTCTTLAILLAGLILTVVAVSGVSSSTDSQSDGLIIDFGNYDIDYFTTGGNVGIPDALDMACQYLGYEMERQDSKVVSIDGIENGENRSWSLFVVEHGSTSWIELGFGEDSRISDYSAVCYGYYANGDVPTPAVDSTGYPVYGYGKPTRVVSLAPSCTETICINGGLDVIVGTDQYSNYPQEVPERHKNGTIAVVGGYTNPSYEVVLKQNPDLVVCLDSQNMHLTLAEKLREVGINVLVLDGGESIDAVLNNTYLTAVVLGDVRTGVDNLLDIESNIDEISDIIQDYDFTWEKRAMVALSAVKSPWVSGNDTYISDVMTHVSVTNIFSGQSGWSQVNAEMIAKYDPEVIIIVSSDYDANQKDYDSMIASIEAEWRGTTAYMNGEIYLLTGEAADCASRPGPRVAELTEIIGRIVQNDAFTDGVGVPKFIGDDYRDYLEITKGDYE